MGRWQRPKWQETKCLFGRKVENSLSSFNGRYVNNDELKFLRSGERYAPWTGKFLLLPIIKNQNGLTNPKIKLWIK